jgi:predicted metal-dependent hydrolase
MVPSLAGSFNGRPCEKAGQAKAFTQDFIQTVEPCSFLGKPIRKVLESQRLIHQSDNLDYQLIRSVRRRSVSIEVHRDQTVLVRAPAKMAQDRINDILQQKLPWILTKQRQQSSRPALPDAITYLDGSVHWYLGQRYRLVLLKGHRSLMVDERLQQIQITQPLEDEAAARDALLNWYRFQAQQVFGQRLEKWTNRINHWPRQPQGMRIRLLKRSWGSCTASGLITMNTLAIKLSAALIDYIICHELCHLMEMNHGSAFYRHQAALLPDHRIMRQQIRMLEPDLLRY